MSEPKEQFADVTVQRLASIYAEAILNAMGDRSGEVLEEVDSLIDDVFRDDRRLEALLAGAAVGRKTREEAIRKCFQGRSSAEFLRLMLVLNDHDRLHLLRPIRRALHDLSDERARRLKVHVYTAIELDEGFQERIRARVQEVFQLQPVLVMHVDTALLGGLMIRIGDRVLDATVRTRVDNLRNQLIARSSHEIQSGRDRFSSPE